MHVGHPISSVIPSLDGPALAVLAATAAPLRLGEVTHRAGHGSRSGVRKALLRLVGAGIVHDGPGGYVLNRAHIAAPAIEALATLHGELVARIGATLDQWGPIVLAGLFGSAARRDGDESSDIDVLVVADGPDLDGLIDELTERILAWTGNEAQVLGLTPPQLREMRDHGAPILDSWERELVVIRGDRHVLRAAA